MKVVEGQDTFQLLANRTQQNEQLRVIVERVGGFIVGRFRVTCDDSNSTEEEERDLGITNAPRRIAVVLAQGRNCQRARNCQVYSPGICGIAIPLPDLMW
jgi:hypothetical protein